MTPEDEKIIRSFFDKEGKLKSFPSQLNKKMVVLGELAKNFEEGRTYTEREVSEALKKFFPDFATLRRELVDGGFFKRENGIYEKLKK
ncbi:DUF2087 domain-containing protein [bacterium]|nr:DUF2087 domain-containing protein [bacterium]